MKCVIDRKKYDTETAKLVGSWSNGLSSSDFDYCCEKLYLKTTGEFFLYGEGGPMSRYAVSCGQNEWSGGAQIIPLEPEKAQAWAEEHLTADEFEEIFGAVSEGDADKRTVTYSLPGSAINKIRSKSLETGLTFSEVVAKAIEAL